MPHGYKCDRCGTFVEQPQDEFVEVHPEMHGRGEEEFHIANPCLRSDEGPTLESYTLCNDCRMALIDNVETFDT